MKIVHIFWSFTVGGAETLFIDIINRHVTTCKIYLIIINRLYNQELLDRLNKKVIIHKINRKVGSKSILKILQLNKILRSINSDVIHTHNANIDRILFKKSYNKLVLTSHSYNNILRKNNKYNKIICISDGIKKDLSSKGIKNLITIYNGIDFEKIHKKQTFKTFKIINILTVGRLIEDVKGQNVLLEAIKKFKILNIPFRLDIIGTGVSEQSLRNFVMSNDLNQNVFFLGLKDRNYIYKSLYTYDLYIQPSIQEGFGLTVVEAMFARLPVIISNADGLMEVSSKGNHCVGVYNKNCFLELTFLIKKFCELDSHTKSKITNDAFNWVRKNYDISQTSDNYLKLYSEV